MDAPAPVRDLYSRIKCIDMVSLVQHPEFVESRKDWFQHHASKLKLQHSVASSNEWANEYGDIQLACSDFMGKCVYCPEPSRNAHGVQSTSVYEIEDFPGNWRSEKATT